MSNPEQESAALDEVTARQLEAVRDWTRRYGTARVPVLVGAPPDPADFDEGEEVIDERDVEFTWDSPHLAGKPGDIGRIAKIRLGVHWRTVDLDSVQVHPEAATVATFNPVPHTDLEFPPPDCTYCEIGLSHDGDGWYCEQCGASWSNNGMDHHRRRCVESECGGAEAEMIGDDGQPRCRPCGFLVSIGRIEATAPYRCREICYGDSPVTGMPADSAAARYGRCGRHQQQADSEAWMKDCLSKSRASGTAATS